MPAGVNCYMQTSESRGLVHLQAVLHRAAILQDALQGQGLGWQRVLVYIPSYYLLCSLCQSIDGA